LAKSLLSARQQDLADLLTRVRGACPVPIAGVVSDGQHSIRRAVARALPGVPHQLCQFHYLREAARPVYEADRHAKKELKKKVRGVRKIERQVEGRTDPQAAVVRGYCAAVRGALTDDGRPPLDAAGLRLRGRLSAVADSLGRLGAGTGGRRRS
jgi:Transposase, Mutator family